MVTGREKVDEKAIRKIGTQGQIATKQETKKHNRRNIKNNKKNFRWIQEKRKDNSNFLSYRKKLMTKSTEKTLEQLENMGFKKLGKMWRGSEIPKKIVQSNM